MLNKFTDTKNRKMSLIIVLNNTRIIVKGLQRDFQKKDGKAGNHW